MTAIDKSSGAILPGPVFLSHQVGSFLGAWLGGLVFDLTGSYSILWGATIVAGVAAAVLHFPISNRPTGVPCPAQT